jgi:rapamycin-insensitive companion of mTOR
MATTDSNASYSVTPTQGHGFISHQSRKSEEFSPESHRPANKDGRSLSSGSAQYGRGVALAALSGSALPGSFSTDLKSANFARSAASRADLLTLSITRPHNSSKDDDSLTISEQRQAIVRDKIAKELKIKLGTENMLEALLAKNAKQTKEQRQRVEIELGTSNRKLAELKLELNQEIQRANSPTTPPNKRMTSYFRGSPLKPPPKVDETEENQVALFEGESPTVVLTETLQALEVEGMTPDYYIDRANTLVELFKRNPTLKYDLAWSVFSLRVRVMLLSDSTDVVAAGYRLTRYAITDRASIRTIRSLHTDELVVLSLVKKGKAVLEREQAIKFVRAFLDVKDGVHEISRAVARTIVAVAEQHDDRLKNICILTLTELLMKHPPLLIAANGIGTLTDTLAEGTFPASESLVASFLHILDVPRRRKYLKSGREFEAIFAPFTDPLILGGNEERLRTCAKAISAMLKNWPGFLTLSMYDASALRSLLDSLLYPAAFPRDLVLELLFDVLRIKPPSWSSTFLAGRRLTTYGRVVSTEIEPATKRVVPDVERDGQAVDLVVHFSALVLATLVKVGLIPALSTLIKSEEDLAIKRKATLLLTEVLKLANHSLPGSMSSHLQVLGDLISPVADFQTEEQSLNMNMVYQIESINKTLNRQAGNTASKHAVAGELAVGPQAVERSKYSASMDAEHFKQAMMDTQVPSHSQYLKWKWDLIHNLIEGPLTNPKRLEEAIKGTKFLKRVVGFYRPFKYRFSMIRNTRPNQRYVRTGCALLRTLAQTSLGIQYLGDNKLLRQIAECLAQVDRQSGLTSTSPLFDRHQMAETLSGGYFTMIGALSESTNGIAMMERWHMMNMFYHIVELRDRDDLIRTLLGNMDFSLDSHLRVILSQALTSASKSIRIFSTRLLRRYAVGLSRLSLGRTNSHWALRLVLTQLYDPDVEVCETAVKILEEACNQRSNLDFVVKCRPLLDHLGEIGAPLLLRFLSTSVGYHYLNGLDYITQEMDDWFLGRNDAYVTLVEASLARAYIDQASQKGPFGEDLVDFDVGLVPPHFYRELARTAEGCKLLRQSGHFYDFTTTIRDFQLDDGARCTFSGGE